MLIESSEAVTLLDKISSQNLNLARVVYEEILSGHHFRCLQKTQYWSPFLTFVAMQPKSVAEQFCRSLQRSGDLHSVEEVMSQQK